MNSVGKSLCFSWKAVLIQSIQSVAALDWTECKVTGSVTELKQKHLLQSYCSKAP